MSSGTNRNAKILIVDDNPANVHLLEMMLEMESFSDVDSAIDPREVEAMHQDKNYDLIMLDINMPHLDGFQVMEALSKIHESDYLPIIVLTAQKEMKTRIKALQGGAKDFVTKPFDRAEVLHRIENMLEVRFLYNERKNQAEFLEEKVHVRTEELHDTRLEIIRRLGRAGEFRDNETGMHVIRMSKSCQRLAMAAGLGEEMAERILQASPMHDIGKIGIRDSVMLKPGKLDADEWEHMKTHAEIGSDIIGEHSSEVMSIAREIAITHHEKWDGSGYPNGLKGEQIPIAGRIAAVCDVFDALTSARPYKKAWSVEDARAYLNDGAGGHFDPELVAHFNDILDDVLAIRDEFADEDQDG
ncbi:MAG: response regulator [Rhodospirillaceae bacterium]|nr:response regulator [Rhodospirillaceae bacterium]